MTQYNTGNPLGSVDVRDLYDNAQNADNFNNGPLDEYADRFGVVRQSLQGIRNASQYVDLGPYAAGLVFTSRNQVFSYNPGTGAEFYAPGPAITLPYTTTGAGAGEIANFRSVGDAILRADLLASDGAERVGRGAGTVETALDALEADVSSLETAQGKEAMFTNSSIFVGSTQATAVLCIGDSNSAGNGQPYGFGGSLMGRTIRSIMNSYDHGIGMDRGYMYESLLALSQELIPARGFSGSGSFVPGPSPALDDRFQLDPGEILTLTGREIAQLQLWYDPALSSGDFTTTVDGVTANVHTVGAGGTTGSFNLAAGGGYIYPTSTVTVTSTTGTKVITGVQAIRKGGSLSPLVYAAPKGSQGFSDFSAPAVVTDLAAIVNSSSASARKLIMVLLGTNNMIATVGKQLTPAAYISALDALIVAYKAALGGDSLCNFAVWVPPQPLEALPLGTYQQYVDAIVAYCAADPRISCIRMDKTVLNTADFYTDTLHLNEAGHIIAAQTICRTLGVELDARFPAWAGIAQTAALAEGVPAPNGTWAAGSAAVRKDLTGRVFMRGSMSKAAGSGVALLGTLPAAFRPSGADRLVVVADDQGVPRGLTIATNGDVTLVIADPLPVQGVFFDGVSFDL